MVGVSVKLTKKNYNILNFKYEMFCRNCPTECVETHARLPPRKERGNSMEESIQNGLNCKAYERCSNMARKGGGI